MVEATRPCVHGVYDGKTGSIQYVVWDEATRDAAIIDPVLDFDEKAGSIGTTNVERLLDFVGSNGLRLQWILDTHPHADHLSAAHILREKARAPTAIGARVTGVQKLWQSLYNWPGLKTDGSQWDHLFSDGETFTIGGLSARVLYSPGHTMCSVTYVIGDAAFVHDTLFMPDSGTARADFPGGNAETLWDTLQAILALPPETRLFTGHDYRPNGRDAAWQSTVAAQKIANVHLTRYPTKAAFVAAREARDRTLPMPRLILPAMQVNVNGGRLPDPEANGRRYLKIPLDLPELREAHTGHATEG